MDGTVFRYEGATMDVPMMVAEAVVRNEWAFIPGPDPEWCDVLVFTGEAEGRTMFLFDGLGQSLHDTKKFIVKAWEPETGQYTAQESRSNWRRRQQEALFDIFPTLNTGGRL